ncbi:hypothetical protein N7499_005863 [Penicillium canescens]|uniref:Aminoglycoside phosphotransferase domain-containing protein n=1 Tax=Penicillium canescens TaxID=5083 RepID=A0AAD6N937_PENCN|nr:uncharacterized protein N7446_001635 [Penicillium canescens]KAJ6043436.1 hypothetical protein N7460_004791 [Penicillium canescens]KAJ6054913.1 hypothetical protein N7444_004011 [Penicillium canescens]KAJ6073858.1 hypothetical protein N7446_001635 [Penicillium canescens]KAJ6080989.1 hypothetical protein N7499_005863 [Penicillium canescens]KAJ6177215.1 hypothetical protein N7485_004129 [Penicillium canescens]
MTYDIYSLDSAIDAFFTSNSTVTRQQCDGYVFSRTGAGSEKQKILQFRDADSTIDMEHICLAKAVHPEFVASCRYLGTLGDSRPLHIYEMENLSGIPHIMVGIQPDDLFRQRNTVMDLARFFAQSWNNDQRPSSADTTILLADFQSNFDLLARDLPSRFSPNINRVRKELPSLFATLPFILSHGDLNMMNVLISPETGNITGIVDWAESRILPFGFALYGLENVLGWMDSEGWHYYDDHRELENLFWKTFQGEAKNVSNADMYLIRVAKMAGIFCQYGYHHYQYHNGDSN